MPVRIKLKCEGPGLFFVTTTVVEHTPIFQIKEVAKEVLDQFAQTSRIYNVSIAGYVLMHSHLHTLVKLDDSRQLSRYIQAFKSLSARRVKGMDVGGFGTILWRAGKYKLWCRGFDDLLIYSEKQFKIKMDYIHNNPVRAGIVADAAAYPYSSARSWLTGENGIISIDRDFLTVHC